MPVILVVEDDQVMRKAIGTILNRGGFSVLNAANGREAIDMLETSSYDLVLTDLMMPYVNGLEVVNHIRNDRSKKNVGVIIVSSTANEDLVTEALSRGADDYLRKPVMAGELLLRIRKLIGSHDIADLPELAVVRCPVAIPASADDIAEDDVITEVNETPPYLIAVSRYVQEQPVTGLQSRSGMPALQGADAAQTAARKWYLEDDGPQDATGMLLGLAETPGTRISQPAQPYTPGPGAPASSCMRWLVTTLAAVAIIVIVMLLYVLWG